VQGLHHQLLAMVHRGKGFAGLLGGHPKQVLLIPLVAGQQVSQLLQIRLGGIPGVGVEEPLQQQGGIGPQESGGNPLGKTPKGGFVAGAKGQGPV
jgi:hypothetical protein